jgi:hypothetical protein
MFPRRIPNFFSRKLHLHSIKKPVFQVVYSPGPQLRVGRQFPPIFALAKSHDPEKADIHSTLPPKASFNNRNNLLIFNILRKTKSTPPSHVWYK